MGWTETNPVNERRRFIADHASGYWTVTDLFARYGISRLVSVFRRAGLPEPSSPRRVHRPRGDPGRLWNILFYSTLLGRFDQASGKITGADFRTEQGKNV